MRLRTSILAIFLVPAAVLVLPGRVGPDGPSPESEAAVDRSGLPVDPYGPGDARDPRNPVNAGEAARLGTDPSATLDRGGAADGDARATSAQEVVPPTPGDPENYPTDYFRSPLGIPLSLTGSFAEMRAGHFHSGLDIRTRGETGYRVYAAAGGHVARVAVSAGGYGNALYLQHPNGYMTVYAHLDRFEEPVATYVRNAQYSRQSFGVNLFPEAGALMFAKGDVIAYSGNSGSSGGPHLHFEIRDAGSSEPLNPLFFGIPVDDTTLPRIFRVRIHAVDPTSLVHVRSANGRVVAVGRRNRPVSVEVEQTAPGRYALARGATIEAIGRIGFSVQAHDYADASSSRLGLFRIELYAGSRRLFESHIERFAFSETRYINAHIDFAERVARGRWFQRSHILPGNRLAFYDVETDGFLSFGPGDRIPIRYRVEDSRRLAAELRFDVTGLRGVEPGAVEPPASPPGFLVRFDRSDTFVRPGIIVRFPSGALYENLEFRYETTEGGPGAFSPAHVLHTPSTPLHRAVTVSIAADDLPAELRDKALVVSRRANGSLSSAGGSWENGYVTTGTRSFGTYEIAVDTTAPTIEPLNIRDGADLSGQDTIRLRIRDDLAGIRRYEGRVDGTWVLFAHDPKNSLLMYTFDDRVGPGPHTLAVRVTDGVGNTETFRARFSR